MASHHANVGHYAANSGYFVAGVDNPPLHALADGVDGPSGVYRYGDTSGFPTDTYASANYWVDVVFSNAPSNPPTVASVSPGSGATAVSTGAVITATFSEPMNPATISTTTMQLYLVRGHIYSIDCDLLHHERDGHPPAHIAAGARHDLLGGGHRRNERPRRNGCRRDCD